MRKLKLSLALLLSLALASCSSDDDPSKKYSFITNLPDAVDITSTSATIPIPAGDEGQIDLHYYELYSDGHYGFGGWLDVFTWAEPAPHKFVITDLKPNTTYEYYMGVVFDNRNGAFSHQKKTFTTKPAEEETDSK